MNSKTIDKLKLENFKCYKHQEFEFSQLTVFCGANSAGKSSAIQALLMLLQSRFEAQVHFNGNLVSPGQYRQDILAHDAESEDKLSIALTSNMGVTRWIYDESIDALLSTDSMLPSFEVLLSSFQYVQAERLGPEDNYKNKEAFFHKNWLGKKGEYTSEIMTEIEEREGDDIRLAKGDYRLHSSTRSVRIYDQIRAWMQEISQNLRVSTQTLQEANISFNTYSYNGGAEVKAKNVGFGMSYSLGVVAALLITPPGGLVIIENPEAHLHPRAQSYLGRLIALSALSGVQVIVETHSDHLLNGIRVIARLKEEYKEGDFCINFVDRDEQGEVQVERLPIGTKAELPKWPNGFFDQSAEDMRILISGKE